MSEPQRFTTTPEAGRRGRVVVPVPFDPDAVWGTKSLHHVHGTVDGHRIRAVIEQVDGRHWLVLGPAWQRDCGLAIGKAADVELAPEGPQRGDLAPDLAAALDANPQAGAFFDALAQFYRRGYLRWIDATTRKPELRAERIALVVGWLAEGIKERPKP
ncbi:YdeI/OmpD-associated family protein [Pseudonocardia sp. GCM10023141]|uniref:YdeI/OmpD-associated family protein n=1 Tax=Pseudonocardia sp. GCM10023141 TaxID=3252653 RepID=UPI00360AD5D9